MVLKLNTALIENYSPVHKLRKFLLVLGQVSEKSWKTILPTTKHNRKKKSQFSVQLQIICNVFR